MKKILKLSLVIIAICIVMSGSVYAVSTKINMQSSKNEVKKDEEFSIEISLADLQTNTGVIAFSGKLEYDKNILTLEKMEGLSEWETPKDGKSYNSATGEFAIERDSVGKNDESVFKITFKVKDDSNGSTTISLKNAMLADGRSTPAKVSLVQKTITIKKDTNNQTPDNPTDKPEDKPTTEDPTNKPEDKPSTEDPTNKPENKPSTENPTNKPEDKPITKPTDNTIANTDIPQTGLKNVWIIIAGLVVTVAGIFFGIKLKSYKF